MRFSKLNTSWGKNFVENKMPEAHWKLECIERGARIVVITPEYNPTAYRADYWMPLRPQSDGSIFLGAMKIIVDENLHDIDFLKGHSDAPLLVRTDTLQFLDPRDVIADFKFPDFSKSYSGRVQSLSPEQVARLGGMMVWDLNKKQAVPLHREQVGFHYQDSGIDAALVGTYRVKLLNGREVDAMPVWQLYLVHFQDYDLDTSIRSAGRRKICWCAGRGIPARSSLPRFITAKGRTTIFTRLPTPAPPRWCSSPPATWASSVLGNVPGPATTRPEPIRPRPGPGLAWRCIRERIPSILISMRTHTARKSRPISIYYGEEVGYWAHGDTPLIVNTPKYGRKVFTGKTHMPMPEQVPLGVQYKSYQQRQAPL